MFQFFSVFFFSSRRRHTIWPRDWSSDVCSSDLWKSLDIDIVVEATGKFNSKEEASRHLEAGAKKVIITAPGNNVDKTIVIGVNEETYQTETDDIISNASRSEGTRLNSSHVAISYAVFCLKK